MKLQKDGRGYSTITSVRGVVKPAFQMAYEEDILRKNPFDFKLSDVVKNDSQKRIVLTQEQEDIFMNFIKTDIPDFCFWTRTAIPRWQCTLNIISSGH